MPSHNYGSTKPILSSNQRNHVIQWSFDGKKTDQWFDCLGFYAVSTVFQLFNGKSSQIHVSWTIFNQYLTSPLSRHWRASCIAIPIILSARGKLLLSVLKTLVCCGRGSNPQPPTHEADPLTTRLPWPLTHQWQNRSNYWKLHYAPFSQSLAQTYNFTK